MTLWLSWKGAKRLRGMGFIDEQKKISTTGKAVLITGCDTGFGHMLAQQLDSMGFTVFAACLTENSDGAKELKEKCSTNLKIIQLDVTNDTQITDAVNYVKENLKGKTFWGLINNAGVCHFTGLEYGPSGANIYELHHNVNSFGMVRVTKAFLPLIRKTRGSRVVFVTSMAGRVIFPTMTSYCMSKHSARCFADGLRRELRSWDKDNRVVVIEPSMYRTAIVDKTLNSDRVKQLWEQTPKEVRDEYGPKRHEEMLKLIDMVMSLSISRPQDVVNAMIDAVSNYDPPLYYRVGEWTDLISFGLMELLPEEIQDILLENTMFKLFTQILKNR